MVYIERIKLCYDAKPDLEGVTSEEAKKFADVYQRLKQLPLSVDTYLHEWKFSSELVFWIEGEEKPFEDGLGILYQQGGPPSAITKFDRLESFLTRAPTTRKAMRISEAIIRKLYPNIDLKRLYVDSCTSRHSKKFA